MGIVTSEFVVCDLLGWIWDMSTWLPLCAARGNSEEEH